MARAADQQPLVSVVTPTFNNEAHLDECIRTVVGQTHSELEYVVVDDASEDATVAIARAAAERDARIRVEAFDQRLGVPGNWNRALELISPSSKYCKVVHGDDWLFPECLERMVAVAEAHPSVAVVSAYRLDNTRVNLDGLEAQRTLVPGVEVCRRTLLGDFFLFGSPTSVLLRANLVRERKPFYPPGSLHSDTEACFELLGEADFGFVHQVLTVTRRHARAVTSRAMYLGTYKPNRVQLVLDHGPRYLEAADYERRLAAVVAEYGLFLAEAAPRLTDPEFRAFHRDALSALLPRLEGRRLVRGTFRQIARSLGKRSA
jgi:glycosyltransferase involved in cell wall biosynthesis